MYFGKNISWKGDNTSNSSRRLEAGGTRKNGSLSFARSLFHPLLPSACYAGYVSNCYRVFSLTWPKSMQIDWDKKNRLQKKRVQFPQEWFRTPIWPPYCHVITLHGLLLSFILLEFVCCHFNGYRNHEIHRSAYRVGEHVRTRPCLPKCAQGMNPVMQ